MSATQKLLGFGVFELNLDTEELSKSGVVVRLPPQPFKLLVLLASHAGQVVARNEIQEQLWVGETFVDFEHGVNKCINQIRTVLGDDADHPIYVQTLPRRGYRFVAPVVSKTISAPQPKVIESDFGEPSRLPVLVASGAGAATATVEVAAAIETAVVPDRKAPIAPGVGSQIFTSRALGSGEPVSPGSAWRFWWLRPLVEDCTGAGAHTRHLCSPTKTPSCSPTSTTTPATPYLTTR